MPVLAFFAGTVVFLEDGAGLEGCGLTVFLIV
jgi:hypothetical protein